MSILSDLKKSIVKHNIIRFLNVVDVDDDICRLLVDKQLKVLMKENKRLKDELVKVKIEGIIGSERTIDVELNGKNVTLGKEEIIELAATYKEKQFQRTEGSFMPEDIIGLTIDKYHVTKFKVHYKDGGTSYVHDRTFYDKYLLYFELFGLEMREFSSTSNRFTLKNKNGETITLSTGMSLSNEFLTNFSKGKKQITFV